MVAVTAPGILRPVELGDLSALVPGGRPGHVGLPLGWRVRHVTGPDPRDGPTHGLPIEYFEVVPNALLEAGSVYFIDPVDALARAADEQVPFSGGLVEYALTAARQAAEAAARVLSFIPLVYVAGDAMTTATPPARPAHARLTFSGIFGSQAAPVEIWSWGLTFAHVDSLGGTTVEAAAKARALYAQHIKPLGYANTILTRTRVALLANGRNVTTLANGAYDQGDDTTAVEGGPYQGAAVFHALQTACAVSFTTARQGPHGKGRAFLPYQGEPLGPDFLFHEGHVTSLVTAVRNVAQGMSTGDGPKLGAHAVISSGGKSGVASVSPVTGYRVGRVPDTMRSRRNALKERYIIGPAA